MDATATFRRILLGYDGREGGRDALALGESLARVTDSRLIVASAYPAAAHHATIVAAGEVEAEMARETRAAVDAVIDSVSAPAGVDGRVAPGSSPAAALHRLADEERADLIVLGSSSRGPVGRLLMGGTGERLLHGAPCAVSVAPRGYADSDRRAGALRTVGIAYDGSVEATFALEAAVSLATAARAELKLLSVIEHSSAPVSLRTARPEAVEEAFDRLVAERREELRRVLDATRDGVTLDAELLAGDPAEELAGAAEALGLDLLVVGSRDYGPVRTVLLGGVSTRLVHTAPCPVLVFPRVAAEASRSGPE